MNTAVAFIIFKRPDTTARVFAAIRAARPPRLYVIADGARPDKPGEPEAVSVTRSLTDAVDWDCEVTRLHSDQNLGCRRRVQTGLDEVFSCEEEAIILEDDCLTDPSFFPYCEELLARYRDEPRVMHISGDNFLWGRCRTGNSYHFSRSVHVWGWATWRRAWQQYDADLTTWGGPLFENNLLPGFVSEAEKTYWLEAFGKILDNPEKNTSWATIWSNSVRVHGGLCIYPQVNLVENIGFDGEATHTFSMPDFYQPPARPIGPLKHPRTLAVHTRADALNFETAFRYQEPRRLRQLKNWLRIKGGALRRKLMP